MPEQQGNNSRTRFKFSSEGKSCLWVVDDVSNGLEGEALRRWFAPNALARTLIMTHSGVGHSTNVVLANSARLCALSNHSLAVSSSTPWRIYA